MTTPSRDATAAPLPNVSILDNRRNRTAVALANTCLKLAHSDYRAAIRGALVMGFEEATRRARGRVEWGVKQGPRVERHSGEDSARWYVDKEGGVVVTRTPAGPWEPADKETP